MSPRARARHRLRSEWLAALGWGGLAGMVACAAPATKAPLHIDLPSEAELAQARTTHPRWAPSLEPTPDVVTIEPARGGPLDESENDGDPPPRVLDRDSFAPDPPRTMHLAWPLPATGVTSLFGLRPDPVDGRERFHYGVDLQGTYGEIVRAVAPGVVVFAGWNHGHGRQVMVTHPGGWQTTYSHLSQLIVNYGDPVRRGQAVGQMGNSGRSTGPHLHFEITRWGSYYDPLDLLGTDIPTD
jgi:murein DD-endopeptidase MepM/ murein hydrolase activator NlpD